MKTDRSQVEKFAHSKVTELVKVYRDVERLLSKLKKSIENSPSEDPPIDLYKLMERLNQSKKKLERKIGNTILLEKQQIRKRFKKVKHQFVQR